MGLTFCQVKSDGISGEIALGITECLDLGAQMSWSQSFFSASAVLMCMHNRSRTFCPASLAKISKTLFHAPF
ncbi:hypothetical protein K737_300095 [Holospora undulata HU1]|uniref:Uncharacterized protein n=1 Tax=Holospora undulata HU1 TaxID=1321371 RepID=A0A061JH50_9PROT|nr:hypothetical protein K737_300095 [Holospora undulata HU1]